MGDGASGSCSPSAEPSRMRHDPEEDAIREEFEHVRPREVPDVDEREFIEEDDPYDDEDDFEYLEER